MHVLTLTPFFPTPANDASGCFIAEPIAAMHRMGIRHSVAAAQPFYRPLPVAANDPAESWISYLALPGNVGLPSAGISLYSKLRSRVAALTGDEPIDLIHAHGALPCGHAAMLLSSQLRVPFVVTVHGLDAYFTKQISGYAGRWCQRICGEVYGAARRVICISQKVRKQVLDGAPGPVNTCVVYNGTDSELFCPESDTCLRTILSVGNLIPIKGHDLLLHAISGLASSCSDVQLQIIGDGPEKPTLRELAQKLKISDRVHFLGTQSRSQVAEAMKRCSVFALPSRYEGLGCVYLEAMAAQKPAIALRGQAIEEIIQHQETGWLSAEGDSASLTASLTELLMNEQLRQDIGLAARESILRGFTIEHQAAALGAIYAGCAA